MKAHWREGGLMWMSSEYRAAHAVYDSWDGIKALLLYVFSLLALVVQGRLYLSSMRMVVLESLNMIVPLVTLAATLVAVWMSRERVVSIGMTKRHLGKSLAFGLALGCLLSTMLMASEMLVLGRMSSGLGAIHASLLLTFFVGALEEELAFRGYIGTRLRGIFSHRVAASLVTSGLFLLSHYAVFWGVSGTLSFEGISAMRIVFILLLHVVCDWTYQRTNCIWGAVALHFLYNIISGTMQFS